MDAFIDACLAVSRGPLFGLFLTLVAYRAALWLNQRCHGHPLSNPVLVGCVLVGAVLLAGGIRVDSYMEGGRLLLLLLGPATVALAVPLYHQFARLRRSAGALALALLAGSLMGIASSVVLGRLFGLPETMVLSLVPRSVTTPIAMGVAEAIGGEPTLAAAFVIVSGILGAVLVRPLFSRLGLMDERVLGFATGVAAHGIGTARVFQVSQGAGAFAALAMGLNGLMTALLAPLLLGWLGRLWH